MTNEEKTNGIRRDYKKVRRVTEEQKTEIRNKMIDELNNEE